MSIKSTIAVLVMFLAVSIDASAEDLDDAVEAMHRGDFAIAYCLMRPLAESGNARAQYNIGWMYMNGYGLRVDDRQALEWWTKSLEQGNTDASFSIGMLYDLGDGKVKKDTEKAIDYYLIAAKDGKEDAFKILKSMMMRNEPALNGRTQEIVKRFGKHFGKKRLVKVKQLNAREGASTKDKVVARLEKGDVVLELSKRGKWSQVIVLGDKSIDQSVWVANLYLK